MKTVTVENAQKVDNLHKVNSKKLFSSNNASIIHITLEPGESLLKHITPVDVNFFVLEGKGFVLIGNEEQEVGLNTLIESPKNIVHCWYNRSSEKLRFLVIKTPKPTHPTIFLEQRE